MNKIYKNRLKPNVKYTHYVKYRDIKEIIEKRYGILIGCVICMIIVLFLSLFYIQIMKNEFYQNRLISLTESTFTSESTPRGRIYDRNHRLLVDNVPVKVIYYKKPTGVTAQEEIEVAYLLCDIISLDYQKLTDNQLRNFFLVEHPDEANEKITEEEWKEYKERKLSYEDLQALKKERITEEELNQFELRDRKAAYIYALMNTGYSYAEKIIKKNNITEEEYAKVAEQIHILKGVNTRLDWERQYPYGNTFKTILGNISSSESGVPYELKDYYLARGYSLTDRVGISYLEYQYEDILKGEKTVYKINSDGTYKVLEEGKRGNDIVLTIDIELQKQVEAILEEELRNAKNDLNTKYYNRSFVVMMDPSTGEILAMAGKQIVQVDGEYKIYDYTPGIVTSPVVVGSAVKGASHIVGYNTGALQIGEVRDDACIKIAATPLKCSYRYYGMIDDIDALKVSSNTYQFQTAIKVGKGNYVYNAPLPIDTNAFQIYRNTFAEFGLGVKTGIDLPVESLGYKGTSTLTGHLLDLAIGQYDSYTPIQLAQYISTIANNGSRMQPYLLKEVYEPTMEPLTNLVKKNSPVLLNKVNTEDKYLERVQLGFKAVMDFTGLGYIDPMYNPAGKTGTSQSFIDTDGNGVVDTETISSTFVGYAPADKPQVAFAILSPDVSYADAPVYYISEVNKKISQKVSKKFFEIYQ